MTNDCASGQEGSNDQKDMIEHSPSVRLLKQQKLGGEEFHDMSQLQSATGNMLRHPDL